MKIESAHRITINSGICPVSRCSVLPKIPVQVVSYDEAEVLLQAIDGMSSPIEWRGGLQADYSLGPNLKYNLQTEFLQTRPSYFSVNLFPQIGHRLIS
jgi:hypothetical protein